MSELNWQKFTNSTDVTGIPDGRYWIAVELYGLEKKHDYIGDRVYLCDIKGENLLYLPTSPERRGDDYHHRFYALAECVSPEPPKEI